MESTTYPEGWSEEISSSFGYVSVVIIHAVVAITALTLNIVVPAILIRSKLLTFPFYSLMFLFNAITVLSQICIIAEVFANDPLTATDFTISDVSNCATKVSWYFTSVLIFLIGLNRMAIFVSGPLHSAFSRRNYILWICFILFIPSTIIGMLTSNFVAHLVNLFGSKGSSQFVLLGRTIAIVDTIFVILPVCSFAFYIAAFAIVRSAVQSTRSNSRFVLNKAEMSILKQGFLICCCYLIPAVAQLMRYFISVHDLSFEIFQTVFYISINLPPIGFPVIMIICSDEFRKHLRLCRIRVHQQSETNTSKLWRRAARYVVHSIAEARTPTESLFTKVFM